jgi:hypothetical protein
MKNIPILLKSPSRKLRQCLIKFRTLFASLATILMALIVIQPANAAIPQNEIRRQQAELTQRIDRIREHLVIENINKTNQGQNPEKIAQWYNWPNWPNWNNWNNWRNY